METTTTLTTTTTEGAKYTLRISFSSYQEAMEAKRLIENLDDVYDVLYGIYSHIDSANPVGMENRIIELVTKIEQ